MAWHDMPHRTAAARAELYLTLASTLGHGIPRLRQLLEVMRATSSQPATDAQRLGGAAGEELLKANSLSEAFNYTNRRAYGDQVGWVACFKVEGDASRAWAPRQAVPLAAHLLLKSPTCGASMQPCCDCSCCPVYAARITAVALLPLTRRCPPPTADWGRQRLGP